LDLDGVDAGLVGACVVGGQLGEPDEQVAGVRRRAELEDLPSVVEGENTEEESSPTLEGVLMFEETS